MNYIQKLRGIGEAHQAVLTELESEILDFSAHLQSAKFYDDPTIQVADVQRFLQRLHSITDSIAVGAL